MPRSSKQLTEEASAATRALSGKVVARIVRNRASEVLLEFTDGTRLFVDVSVEGVELSVSGGKDQEHGGAGGHEV